LKTQSTKWIADYQFSENDRAKLLKVWPRKNDKEKAVKFILAIQRNLKYYLLFNDDKSNTKDKNNRVNDLIKYSNNLIKELDRLPNDICGEINGLVKENLYFSENKKTSHVLKAASDAMSSNNTQPAFFEMADIIKVFLNVIILESKKTLPISTKSGKNISREIYLIKEFAKTYYDVFNEVPASGNRSKFRNFIKEFSNITNITLGAPAVNHALKSVTFSK